MIWYYPNTGKQTATTGFTRYIITNDGTATGIVFKASNLIIQNSATSDNDIEISWDGTNTHFHIEPGEPLNLGNLYFTEIWIKKSGGTVTFRIASYAK